MKYIKVKRERERVKDSAIIERERSKMKGWREREESEREERYNQVEKGREIDRCRGTQEGEVPNFHNSRW